MINTDLTNANLINTNLDEQTEKLEKFKLLDIISRTRHYRVHVRDLSTLEKMRSVFFDRIDTRNLYERFYYGTSIAIGSWRYRTNALTTLNKKIRYKDLDISAAFVLAFLISDSRNYALEDFGNGQILNLDRYKPTLRNLDRYVEFAIKNGMYNKRGKISYDI